MYTKKSTLWLKAESVTEILEKNAVTLLISRESINRNTDFHPIYKFS